MLKLPVPIPSIAAALSGMRLFYWVLLVGAGLVGNYCNYPIFLDINFLFGSIFAMLALQYFGLGRGILAAAIIASSTYFIWNHPYAILIMTGEVALVGWLMERRQIGMVLADTIYWLVIGIPLVYLFYHGIMDVPPSNTYIVMTKQAVNGITNALVARLVFTIFALQSRVRLISLSDIIYNLLAFFVLFPSLVMLAISSRHDFNTTDRAIRTTLAEGSQVVVKHLESWLVNREMAITNLAELAAVKSPQELQPLLNLTNRSDSNYQRICWISDDGLVQAASPSEDEAGRSNIGIKISDSPEMRLVRQSGNVLLSGVVPGRSAGHNPTILLVDPILVDGQYKGCMSGVLDFGGIKADLDTILAHKGMSYSLVDKENRIIITNRNDQQNMAPFARLQGTSHPLEEGISQWVPVVPPQTPISERWKQSLYVAESTIGKLAEWKLILELPVAPFQKSLYTAYTGKLSLLFLILLGALALAELLSRRSIGALAKLRLITNDLPDRLMTADAGISWPTSGIQEPYHLIKNFQEMSNSLSEQFATVRQVNASLTQRMVELRESEARFASMFREHSAVMLLIEPTTGAILDANFAAEQFYQYPREALLKMNIGDINTLPPAEMNTILEEVRNGSLNYFVAEHRKASGTLHAVEVHAAGIQVNDSIKLFSIVNDITERKRIEEENARLEAMNRQLQKAESLGMMAGAIAHHFNNQLAGVLGNLEMAQEDLRVAKVAIASESLAQASFAAHKAATVSSQMLTYLGQKTGDLADVDLAAICRQAMVGLEATAPAGCTLVSDLPEPGPIIAANAEQIQQVLISLVTNAWEAPKAGTITIRVARADASAIATAHRFPVGWQALDCPYGCLMVTDGAGGISAADIDRIFDPFFSSKFPGRGLGLPLALGIVKGHKGVITVASQSGQGSTFSVFLPGIATA